MNKIFRHRCETRKIREKPSVQIYKMYANIVSQLNQLFFSLKIGQGLTRAMSKGQSENRRNASAQVRAIRAS